MGESILPVITLSAAFFAALFVMVAASSELIIESQRQAMLEQVPDSVTDVLLDEFLTTWPPNPYTVTEDDDHWYWTDDPVVTFDPGGGEEHPLKMWVVRNDPFKENTADYLIFQQIYGWFGTKEKHVRVPYKLIEESYSELENYSRISLDLRYQMEVFIWTNDPTGLPSVLWTGEYNVTVGVGLNETLESLSPWGMVGKIMTFRMPNTPWYVNVMIATPIMMMLIYTAFCIIRSVIPLLSG